MLLGRDPGPDKELSGPRADATGLSQPLLQYRASAIFLHRIVYAPRRPDVLRSFGCDAAIEAGVRRKKPWRTHCRVANDYKLLRFIIVSTGGVRPCGKLLPLGIIDASI